MDKNKVLITLISIIVSMVVIIVGTYSYDKISLNLAKKRAEKRNAELRKQFDKERTNE